MNNEYSDTALLKIIFFWKNGSVHKKYIETMMYIARKLAQAEPVT
jgi:hypothetical protein